MSVGVYMETPGESVSEFDFFIPVAAEAFFLEYWQPAIDALHLKYIQNGVSLRKEDLPFLLSELDQLEDWALLDPKLRASGRLQFMLERIALLKKMLPSTFERREDAVLWMG